MAGSRSRLWRNMALAGSVLLAGVLAGGFPALAAGYTYQVIADTTTPRPDGAGNFSPCCQPTVQGPYVVFSDNYGNANESIWSRNILTGVFTKLVDLSTPVPGGTGDFVGFETCQGFGQDFQVRDGFLLFYGADAGAPGCGGGLYSVPVAGGTIKRIIDYHATLPDVGTLASFSGPFGQFGKTVAFAAAGGTGHVGVFTSGVNARAIAVVADDFTPGPDGISHYGTAAIGAPGVTFIGTESDPSNTPNDIFLNGAGHPIVTYATQLPGNPNPAFHTRFALEEIDNKTLYFVANDANGTYSGIFQTGGGPLTKVVSDLDSLPGEGALTEANSFVNFAVDQGTVAFNVAGSEATQSAIFAGHVGAFARVIGQGDPLLTGSVTGFGESNTNMLSDGRVAFTASIDFNSAGVYLASPACAVSIASRVSVVAAAPVFNAASGTATQQVSVTNISASTLVGPITLVVDNLSPAATVTNATGTTVCLTPANTPFLTAATVLAAGARASVTIDYADASQAPISFTPVVTQGAAH